MVVIANAEPLLDQVTDHRTGPDTGLVASLDRPQSDDDCQRLALLLGQLRRRAFRDRGSKSLDVIGVVPLEPAIHGAACDAELGSDLDDASPLDIRTDSTTATPLAKVVLELRFDNKLVQLLQLHTTASRASDCLPCLGFRHDQRTMILSRSAVKSGS